MSPTSSHKAPPNIPARILLATFTLLGFAAGALAMYIGWQHNAQGEFYDEAGVYWGYWISIGLSWFAAIAGVPWLIAAAVVIASRLRRR